VPAPGGCRWATFIGLAILLLTTPMSGFFVKRLTTLRRKMLKETDSRVKLMNQLLVGIRVLKLYAWESAQEAMVRGECVSKAMQRGLFASPIPGEHLVPCGAAKWIPSVLLAPPRIRPNRVCSGDGCSEAQRVLRGTASSGHARPCQRLRLPCCASALSEWLQGTRLILPHGGVGLQGAHLPGT
jgi:ABC transporter transmembrane region